MILPQTAPLHVMPLYLTYLALRDCMSGPTVINIHDSYLGLGELICCYLASFAAFP